MKSFGGILSPMVFIKSDHHSEIQLNWNFRGIQSPQSQKNHFFFFGNISFDTAKILLHTYHSQLSYGEIMGVFDYSEKRDALNLKLHEKMTPNMANDFLAESQCRLNTLIHKLEQKLSDLSKRSGTILLYIFIDCNEPDMIVASELYQRMKIKVQKNKEEDTSSTIIINIVSNEAVKNFIDYQNAVNLFSWNSSYPKQICTFLKKYYSNIRLSKLTTQIQIMNQEQFIFNSRNIGWKNIDFNIIQKRRCAITSFGYVQDLFFTPFNNLRGYRPSPTEIKFSLQYQLLDGTTYISEQKFVIFSQQFPIKNRTEFLHKNDFQFSEVWKNFKALNNFGSKQTIVYLNDCRVETISQEDEKEDSSDKEILVGYHRRLKLETLR